MASKYLPEHAFLRQSGACNLTVEKPAGRSQPKVQGAFISNGAKPKHMPPGRAAGTGSSRLPVSPSLSFRLFEASQDSGQHLVPWG